MFVILYLCVEAEDLRGNESELRNECMKMILKVKKLFFSEDSSL